MFNRSTLRWNHRSQNVRWIRWSEVQRGLAAENRGRTVARIVVQERPAAAELVLEIRQACAGCFAPLVVAAAHGKGKPIAKRHDDRGRPELDVERHDLIRRERLRLVM